ncbi:MAG: PSD1 and planctomycete cytochrome C domain-containing protein [Fimbriiglobus sp.]
MWRWIGLCWVLGLSSTTALADDFFEAKIRPVLVEKCYKCHSAQSKSVKGGLRLDSRAGLLAGGESGPAIVAKDVKAGTFLEAIRYKNPDLQMPPTDKLPHAVIKDFETWIATGAAWPTETGTETVVSKGFEINARKAEHWAWKPIARPAVPKLDSTWPRDDVDRFLLAKLTAKNLTPAGDVDAATWLRRASFAMRGLPPSVAEVAEFQRDSSPVAREKILDRWLNSTAYAERWARHWLDVVRYAETRGHEFDYAIPNIHEYRDYVIRAFQDDVPYDQFVKEHIAGDCLPKPRISKVGNESVIGTAFWHLGEEVHSPVDIRQDQADRFDNRIDVFSKTFLGLTVSCARCHDHKFDAISAKDHAALFGLLEGSSYRQTRFNSQTQDAEIAREWQSFLKTLTPAPVVVPESPTIKWAKANPGLVIADFTNSPPPFSTDGPAITHLPAGSQRLTPTGDAVTASPEPFGAMVYDRFWDAWKLAPGVSQDSLALGTQVRAGLTVRTPQFTLTKPKVFALVRGDALLYAAISQHIVVSGPLHGALVKRVAGAPNYRWVEMNLSNYIGKRFHLELSAHQNSDFAVAMVVQADAEPFAVPAALPSQPLTAEQNKSYLAKAKELQARLTPSRLVPSLWDADGVDATLFVRGNPRTPGEVVPRRSLEALAGSERIAHTTGSGRYELAQHLTDPNQNPFLDRVIVNRIWHHLFGRGLVPTVDNFGVLGEKPSHPELLDYLATEFAKSGRQFKPFIRRLMLTRAYAMQSQPISNTQDPTNELLHHFRIRRLEGEAIRDAMLVVSGRLNDTPYGPSVPIHLTPFLEGRGRPGSGPIDGAGRRSIYLSIKRNFLSPFLITFDTPIPFSSVGRRQISNVPAQSLILLNDPMVHELADHWASRHAKNPDRQAAITQMYLEAFGREPTAAERQTLSRQPAITPDLAHTLMNLKEFIYVR